MEYEISILNQQVVALQEQVDQLTSVAPMAGEQSATERLTLRLKRKGGQLGIGIRSDNFVKEVDAGGAAEDAGFLPGDWIVSVGGTVVVNEDELTPLLQAVGAAATTAIVIRYSPTAFPDRVVPGNAPPTPSQTPRSPKVPVVADTADEVPLHGESFLADERLVHVELLKSPLGLGLGIDDENYVTRVTVDSQAARTKQIFPGDHLVSLNGVRLDSTTNSFVAVLSGLPHGSTLDIALERRGSPKLRSPKMSIGDVGAAVHAHGQLKRRKSKHRERRSEVPSGTRATSYTADNHSIF